VSSRYRWVILATGAVGAGAFSALRMGLPSLGPALRSEYGLSLGEVGLAFAALGSRGPAHRPDAPHRRAQHRRATGPGALLYPLLALAAISTMSWNGLAFTAAAEISGHARAGTAMSLHNTLISVGGVAAPSAFGVLVEATSWTAAYVVLALAPLAAFAVLAPLEGEEDDRIAARALRARQTPEPIPMEAT
jgi:hypothetical protein